MPAEEGDRVRVEEGDRVRIDYVARRGDGTVFDTSKPDVAEAHGLSGEREFAPLAYVVGSKPMVAALDDALVGTAAGETRTVRIPHEDFVQDYGPVEFERMVGEAPRPGLTVHAEGGMIGEVVEIRDDAVSVDFYPERRGETLEFELTVLDVEDGSGS